MQSSSIRMVVLALPMVAALVLSGCGGGGEGGSDAGFSPPPGSAPPPVAASRAEASRFLAQASFGPSQAQIDALNGQRLDNWLDTQFAAPLGAHLPLYQTYSGGVNDTAAARIGRQEAWFERALTAPDALRQRVAFALSEIMVVSETGATLNRAQHGLAWYYDILVANAFGNFRTLIEQVTLAPVMGRYLSMLGNQKPNPATGLRADENFARELMQLFAIGLVQLNLDGTPRLSGGQPIPSYSQDDIEGLARVFTGWWFAGAPNFGANPENWTAPMVPFETFHDRDAKTIVGNVAIPAGLDAAAELDLALDTLFNHPNAGPFIGRQLIQKLVTSNPSPAYVARVASAFNDNGAGVRGDLRAVLRAILLDDEARRGTAAQAAFGKPREPLLTLVHLWRAFGAARGANGRYTYTTANLEFGQAALSAPSVFNFFSPGYAPPGPISDAGLFAPEFQLANESSIALAFNRLAIAIYRDYVGNPASPPDAARIDLAPLTALASNPDALVEAVNARMTSGQLSAEFKTRLSSYLATVPLASGDGRLRAQDALYLVLTSPQYLVQN